MKHLKTTLLLLFLTSPFLSQAQFLGGFFSQQSQKEKLMVAQIAGYEMYLSGIKSAYKIAGKGLSTAHGLKNGTFNLHNGYITSLRQVTPAIRDDPKGKAIAGMQQDMISQFQAEMSWQQKQKLLSAAEISYLQKVSDNVQAKAKLDMDELNQVLTPGKLQLTDAERLQRLDHLYEAMKDKKAFAGYFTAKCRKLAISRQHAKQEREKMRELYGIQ